MRVFLRSMCLKKSLLRDVFENLICCLDHWLSCIHVYVFLLSKNCFEKLARHLLDSQLFVELPKLFFIAILSAPRYLVDRSRKLDRKSTRLNSSHQELSRGQKLSRSIHQVLRCYRDCDKKKLRKLDKQLAIEEIGRAHV